MICKCDSCLLSGCNAFWDFVLIFFLSVRIKLKTKKNKKSDYKNDCKILTWGSLFISEPERYHRVERLSIFLYSKVREKCKIFKVSIMIIIY